jgi:photosystem II stability/assembly factor-like uncharacterized protein
LLRTTDGRHFTVQPVTTSPIYGVSFALSTFGIAVGDSGTILSTTDGGASWTPQSSGTTNALIGVYVLDQNIAIAVGTNGTILRTEDGGATWTPQYATNAGANLFGVSFADANNGIAVGDSGTILLTADGGQSWMTEPSGTTNHLQTVSFIDVATAIAVGDFGTILRSIDGGATWESASSNAIRGHLYGLSLAGPNRALAVGCATTPDGACQHLEAILRTDDGGATWQDISSGRRKALFAISFFGPAPAPRWVKTISLFAPPTAAKAGHQFRGGRAGSGRIRCRRETRFAPSRL